MLLSYFGEKGAISLSEVAQFPELESAKVGRA